MNFLSLIEAKRDGQTLDPAQIKEIIAAYTAGKIPDYQMAAFLMAVYFRGLTPGGDPRAHAGHARLGRCAAVSR